MHKKRNIDNKKGEKNEKALTLPKSVLRAYILLFFFIVVPFSWPSGVTYKKQ